jgi:1,2-dihydroxy-3-keto-5-methylthiopentene dioxygenase
MTQLTCYALTANSVQETKQTCDHAEIQTAMAQIGIGFERWAARHELAQGADQPTILAAYADEVASLCKRGGYQSVDVIRLTPDHPDRVAMRAKFLHEHVHEDDEVRFFVEGEGAFYIRTDTHVYRMTCTRDDLLVVPKGTRHWFDMGDSPSFCAIRLFTRPDGWQAHFTGDPIADHVPGFGR